MSNVLNERDDPTPGGCRRGPPDDPVGWTRHRPVTIFSMQREFLTRTASTEAFLSDGISLATCLDADDDVDSSTLPLRRATRIVAGVDMVAAGGRARWHGAIGGAVGGEQKSGLARLSGCGPGPAQEASLGL